MMISILIVNYNGLIHLPECLESIQKQSFTEYEIVFVDNGSHDKSISYVTEHFPQVHIIESSSNLGFAGGNNLGLQHCSGQWIFFLNNDTVLDPDCLMHVHEAIQTSQADVLSCLMLDYFHPEFVDNAGDTFFTNGLPFSWRGWPLDHPEISSDREVLCACGGASVWSRQVLDTIGNFDDDFFLNYEDVDLSLRARHAGYTIRYLSQAKVFHKGSATMGRYTRTSVFYSVRNLDWMRLKNYPLPLLIRQIPKTVLAESLLMLKYLVKGAGWWWLQARIHQWIGLPQILRKRKQIFKKAHPIPWEQFLQPSWWQNQRLKRQWQASSPDNETQ